MPVTDQFFQFPFANLLAILVITRNNRFCLVIFFHTYKKSHLFLFSRGKL